MAGWTCTICTIEPLALNGLMMFACSAIRAINEPTPAAGNAVHFKTQNPLCGTANEIVTS